MGDEEPKSAAVAAMKRALAAKKAKAGGGGPSSRPDAKAGEKTMAHQAAALNKPAFRRASKRG